MITTNELGRRATSRHDVFLPATLTIADVDFDTEIENVSLGGALVRSTAPLMMGARVGLCFVLDGLHEVIDATAIVRWRTETQIGIQFESLRAREMWALGHYLKDEPAAISA
jgi:PilZ domain